MSFDSLGDSGSGGFGLGSDGKMDSKLKMAQGELQLQLALATKSRKLTGMCWDICDVSPKDKLDSKQEYCLANCVERYIDTETYIKNRLTQKAS